MSRKKGQIARVYSPEERANALKVIDELGLAKAVVKTGIPKSTLHLWAEDANVATASETSRLRTEAATQASRLSRKQKLAESRDRMTMALVTIAELGARVEIEVLKRIANDPAHKLGEVRMSEVVGARTRAIHDLQLLDGEATERPESVIASVEDAKAMRDKLRQRMSGAS